MEFLNRIRDFFIWLYDYVLDKLFDGIITMLSAIPVPSFLTDMTAKASAISGMAGYYLNVFEIGSGVGIILSAYLIRFIIRRIPVIG